VKRKRLNPQEKKLLSYTKDCRNMFAESRSLSRFAIAKRRAMSHQAFRLAQKQTIKRLIIQAEPEFELLESKETALKIKSWRKLSDRPLGEIVLTLLEKRKKYGIIKKLKISKILIKSERRSPIEWRSFRWGLSKKVAR